MRRITTILIIATIFTIVATPTFASTWKVKSGETVYGKISKTINSKNPAEINLFIDVFIKDNTKNDKNKNLLEIRKGDSTPGGFIDIGDVYDLISIETKLVTTSKIEKTEKIEKSVKTPANILDKKIHKEVQRLEKVNTETLKELNQLKVTYNNSLIKIENLEKKKENIEREFGKTKTDLKEKESKIRKLEERGSENQELKKLKEKNENLEGIIESLDNEITLMVDSRKELNKDNEKGEKVSESKSKILIFISCGLGFFAILFMVVAYYFRGKYHTALEDYRKTIVIDKKDNTSSKIIPKSSVKRKNDKNEEKKKDEKFLSRYEGKTIGLGIMFDVLIKSGAIKNDEFRINDIIKAAKECKLIENDVDTVGMKILNNPKIRENILNELEKEKTIL